MTYQYDKLDKSKNEIRLIRFLRRDETPLQISMNTVSKDESPQYHCLSYVWGDPTPIWPIVVDGTQILVTQNLGEALKRVAAEEDVGYLWVDAICINQKDKVEKLHQVHMMSEIYSNAVGVLAWLGPEANSSGEIMDEISKSGKVLVSNLLNMPYPEGVKLSMAAALGLGFHRFVLLMLGSVDQLAPIDRTGWKSVPGFWYELGWGQCDRLPSQQAWTTFCLRPYWKRVWILQELANARSAYILCGTRREPLCLLLAILRFQFTISGIRLDKPVLEWLGLLRRTFKLAPILRCLVLNFLGDTSDIQTDLLSLLQDCGTMGATVPQDRIFALSALTTDDLRLDLNYSKDLSEYLEDIVRHRFIRCGLQQTPLDINLCPWSSGSASWVANDTRGFGINSLRSTTLNLFCLHFSNAVEDVKLWQDFKACVQTPSTVSQLNFPRPGILKLQCVLLGKVQRQQCLATTDEEESRYQIVLRRAVDSNLLPDDDTAARSRVLLSSLAAVSVLQKLVFFLDDTDERKLSNFNIPQDHGSKDHLMWQILSLFIRPNKNTNEHHQRSQDFCREYEDAIQSGFRLICSLSETVLSLTGDDDERWRVFHRTVNRPSMFYVEAMDAMCVKRSVFDIPNGWIGLGPDTMQNEDCVVIVPGIGVPYVVRPVGSDLYTIIGDAYIPGIMYGELFEDEKAPESTWMEFC